eukprot:4582657-Pleurochrysis_carterae.AAC.1
MPTSKRCSPAVCTTSDTWRKCKRFSKRVLETSATVHDGYPASCLVAWLLCESCRLARIF